MDYTTLHYTTPHCTTPHCTILHYTTLHYTTLHYTALHYTTLHYTVLHYTSAHYVALHHTALHHTTLHHSYTTLHHSYTWLLCYCRIEEEESLKGLHRVLSRAIQAFYLIHLLRTYVDNHLRGNDINVIDGTYVRLCVRASESTKILGQMVTSSATLCSTHQYSATIHLLFLWTRLIWWLIII